MIDTVELTLIDGAHEGDIFMKEWRQNFSEVKSENFEQGKFITYEKE